MCHLSLALLPPPPGSRPALPVRTAAAGARCVALALCPGPLLRVARVLAATQRAVGAIQPTALPASIHQNGAVRLLGCRFGVARPVLQLVVGPALVVVLAVPHTGVPHCTLHPGPGIVQASQGPARALAARAGQPTALSPLRARGMAQRGKARPVLPWPNRWHVGRL